VDNLSTVMAGHSRPKDGVLSYAYVPAIHVFLAAVQNQDMDARHEAGHDSEDAASVRTSTYVPYSLFKQLI